MKTNGGNHNSGNGHNDPVVNLVNAKMKLIDAIGKSETKLAEQRATLDAINAKLAAEERKHAVRERSGA